MKVNRLTPNKAVFDEFGHRLSRIRKQRRLSQAALAEEAGVGVATLRRLEGGGGGQLSSWLKILKALDMTSGIDAFIPESVPSPMAEARSPEKRARRRRTDSVTPFTWGDERA